MHAFIRSGQYQAVRRRELTATHVADVQHLIAEAAATVQKDAAEAARATAIADKVAAEAGKYAKQAKTSEAEAKRCAARAKKSANDAEAFAAQARESAKTACKAQAEANQAAAVASHSATCAQSSYDWARGSAAQAWTAAKKAREHAHNADNAGKDSKDSKDADRVADEAKNASVDKQGAEALKWRKEKEFWREYAKNDDAAGDDDDSGVPGWLKDAPGTVFNYGKAILTNGDIWAGAAETFGGILAMGVGSSGIARVALCALPESAAWPEHQRLPPAPRWGGAPRS
ncbi:hypothetical protein [Streptomyces chattanoogensis]|uniref:hypothetical protein n=1 Tax=Streptomyces chattanoogensis TaxID=66876 RepID=UPI0036AE8489